MELMAMHNVGTIAGVPELLKLVSFDPALILWVIGAAVFCGLLVLAYQGLLKFKDKAKSLPFLNIIKNAAGRTPAAVADPARRARLDDLRKKFEEGVEKFRSNGKDIYSVPWYLLVGPAGSGKTEAMRHCKVGFPPGLQDCFQGAGGTLNMHWWFTNYAVVLDTAGRMFMEEAALQGGSEWREFLKLLKQSRPNAPVNGMLLVIGIDNLIKDTSEQIDSRAGHIAKQLDTIQRALDVRFPVYVVITKCDLITGFKEFFDKIDDPQLQHQMLGWSNPAPLDEAFKADAVDQHIRTVRDRLVKRRMTLLLDPVHTEDPQARRTDQVDELFALPDNLAKIAPRLRRYLEIIFQVGEWSPKPLFLRGIYFTSSMRQGQALDEEVASALGVPVDAIPGGKVWDEERSFFLRDVFMSKVFQEKGLVTRATSVAKEQTSRRRLVIGSGIGVAAALTAAVFFSNYKLRQNIREPLEFWTQVRDHVADDKVRLVTAGFTAAESNYSGNEEVDLPDGKTTRAGLIGKAAERAATEIPAGLLGGGDVVGGVNKNQVLAFEALAKHAILGPALSRARGKLAQDDAWSLAATPALAELVAIETRALSATPAIDAKPPDAAIQIAPVLAYLFPPDVTHPDDLAVKKVQSAIGSIAADRFAELALAGTPETTEQVSRAIEHAEVAWKSRAMSDQFDLGKLAVLEEASRAFSKAESDLRGSVTTLYDKKVPDTIAEYNQFSAGYKDGVDRLDKLATDKKLALLTKDWAILKDKSADSLVDSVKRGLQQDRDRIAGGLPVPGEGDKKPSDVPGIGAMRSALDKAWELASKDLLPEATRLKKVLAEDPARRAIIDQGRSGRAESGFESLLALHKTVQGVLVSADTPATWLETISVSRTIEQAVQGASKSVGEWQLQAPEALKGLGAASAAERAVQIARGGRMGSVVSGMLTKVDATPAGLGKFVADESAGKEPGRLGAIALTKLTGETSVDSAYAPKTAAALFQGWKLATDELKPDRKAFLVDASESEGKYKRVEGKIASYAGLYKAYWYDDVLQTQAQVRAFESWESFTKAYAGTERPSPTGVNTDLATLSNQAGQALRLMGETLGKSDYKKLGEDLLAEESLLTGALDATGKPSRTIKASVDELSRYAGMDARSARAAVLAAVGKTSFEDDLSGVFADSIPTYWKHLVERSFKALALDYQNRSKEAITQLKRDAVFPLVNDGAASQMDPAKMNALGALVTEIQLAADTGPRPVPTQLALRKPIADMGASGALTDPVLAKTLEKIAALAKVFAGQEGTSLVVSLKGMGDKGKPSAAWGENSFARWGADNWQAFSVVDGKEQPLGRPVTPDGEGALLEIPKAPGAGLVLKLFSSQANGAVVASANFDGPWTAARLLLTPDARPEPAGAKESATWLVPVVFVENEAGTKGRRLYFWVLVTLRAPLPVASDWPTPAQLGK